MNLRSFLQSLGTICLLVGPPILVLAFFGWDSFKNESGWKSIVHEHTWELVIVGGIMALVGMYLAPPMDYHDLSADTVAKLNDLPLSELRGRSPAFVLCELLVRMALLATAVGAILWSWQTIAAIGEARLFPLALFSVGLVVAIFLLTDLREFIWPTHAANNALAKIERHCASEKRKRMSALVQTSYWERLTFGTVLFQMKGVFPGISFGCFALVAFVFVSPIQAKNNPGISLSGLARAALLDPWVADYSIVHVLFRVWPGDLGTIFERENLYFVAVLLVLALYLSGHFLHGVSFWGDYRLELLPDLAQMSWWGFLFACPILVLFLNALGVVPLPRILVWYLLWLFLINTCSLGALSHDKWAAEYNRKKMESAEARELALKFDNKVGHDVSPEEQRRQRVAWVQQHLCVSRVSEDQLALFSLLGGEMGSRLGRLLFHHKTSAGKVEMRAACELLFGKHIFLMIGLFAFLTWTSAYLKQHLPSIFSAVQ